MNPVPDMDGRLYWAILRSRGRWADSLYDLRKIKVLNDFTRSIDPYYERPWGKLAPGDFSAIGEMENLHTLIFFSGLKAKGEVLQVNDFSFLPRCRKLKKLDLENTSFTDCSLLAGLPNLKQVRLPARGTLEHAEVLDALTCKVTTDEPFSLDDLNFPELETVPSREIPPPTGEFAIRCLELDRWTYMDGEITQGMLDKLARRIRNGAPGACWMTLDSYGEEDGLSVDLNGGWAALAVNLWDEEGDAYLYLPVNEKYPSVEELAPVEIGGQSPVSKRFALDDLDLAAECALYFAKTGGLYPGIQWAKFD